MEIYIINHISKKATVRHESPPGDQAQFDWTEYEVLVGSRYQKVYCFAMILAASRKKAVCFSLKVDAEAIYEAIQELYNDSNLIVSILNQFNRKISTNKSSCAS